MDITLILIIVAVLFVTLAAILKRYRRCPSDKILVIYGKTGKNASGSISSARCIHGGAAFIWPVFQDYAFLDLKPISIECNLTNALSKQNIRVDVPCRFTVGISTDPENMTNAAERLLGLSVDSIQSIATDILFGQLRLVIATMDIEEINADRDKDIRIAETTRDTRIKTAEANALAVEGENSSKIAIANSDALRREKEAEAARVAVAAEKVQAAKALQEAYQSERDAELARAEREKATQQANIVVPAEIEKQRLIIEAEAEAEKLRRTAKGEADAIFAKMDAQARGTLEILTKQADGFGKLVEAAGGDAREAITMLISDKLPELVKTQVEAVKGIKIDKVTVWDGNGAGKDGKSSTAGFISGLMGSVPPLQDLFKMAGLDLPSYLKGKDAPEEQEAAPAEKEG